MDKGKLKIILRVCGSCVFVGYLSLKVDWVVIIAAFRDIDLFLYFFSTVLAGICSFFIAGKYYVLIRGSSLNHSVFSLVRINFISMFYSLFLPSAVGKEAVRWYKITRNQKGRSFFLASTIFERLSFLFTSLLFGFIPLLFYTSHSEIGTFAQRIMPLAVSGFCLICIFLSYYMVSAVRSYFNSAIYHIFGRQWRHLEIDSFLANFHLQNPKLLLYASIFGLSFAWQLLFLSRLFVLFNAASLSLSFFDIVWMGSLVLLLQVLPISFAGIGVREGAYAYLFTMFNIPAEEGVLIGILIFSQMLIMAILGGLFEVMER